MAKCGAETRKLAPILKYHCKIWFKFPDWHKQQHGLGRAVAISCGPLVGCCYFSAAVGHNRTVHAKTASNDTEKNGFDVQIPPQNLAHFCCAKFRHHKFRRFLNPPPPTHSVGSLFLSGALDSPPFFPSHAASGRCVLSAAAVGALAGVVSAFAEPSRWCAGAVLDVAGCAVCASAAPSSWRIEGPPVSTTNERVPSLPETPAAAPGEGRGLQSPFGGPWVMGHTTSVESLFPPAHGAQQHQTPPFRAVSLPSPAPIPIPALVRCAPPQPNAPRRRRTARQPGHRPAQARSKARASLQTLGTWYSRATSQI